MRPNKTLKKRPTVQSISNPINAQLPTMDIKEIQPLPISPNQLPNMPEQTFNASAKINEIEEDEPSEIIKQFASNSIQYLGKKGLKMVGLDEMSTGATTGMLSDLNKTLDDPELKKELSKTLNHLGDYTSIAVKAMDKPLDEAAYVISKTGASAIAGTISESNNLSRAFIRYIPFLGPIVAIDDILSASMNTIRHMVDAANDVTGTIQQFTHQTKENIDDELQRLATIKQQQEQILGGLTAKGYTNSLNPQPHMRSVNGKINRMERDNAQII